MEKKVMLKITQILVSWFFYSLSLQHSLKWQCSIFLIARQTDGYAATLYAREHKQEERQEFKHVNIQPSKPQTDRWTISKTDESGTTDVSNEDSR